VALKLKQALPDATHLTLGFEGRAGLSQGTAKTMSEATGARVREAGQIVSIPLASRTRRIDFGAGEQLAVAIPWGDVSTAYYSTGIANIEVFTASSPTAVKRMRRAHWLRPLLRQRWVNNFIKRGIERRLVPPDATQRASNPSFVWGEVRNAAGEKRTAQLRTANGYSLTVTSSLGILAYLLEASPPAGFHTPGLLMGADFVTTLPGSSPIQIRS
jgi:short subunit dehydrogenase-like uncharacterized protein